jgi:hypothetical protein
LDAKTWRERVRPVSRFDVSPIGRTPEMLFEWGHEHEHGSSLGTEYLVNDAGYITSILHAPVNHAITHPHATLAPAPSLVYVAGGDLDIRLNWDASVANAPSGFTTAVIRAAQLYVADFAGSNRGVGTEVINISVGYGEIAGSAMAASALGESESYGYLVNYTTVTHALAARGYSFTAANEPTGAQFFVTSAEAKAFRLESAGAPGTDGFVGFSTLAGTGYHWNFASVVGTSNTGTGAGAFDFEAVVWHEISEVMGRIGMEGQIYNGLHTYTPLDLFNFKSPGQLALAGNGGYFSLDNGATPLGRFNNASANGGDITDWASPNSATLGLAAGTQDAYNAFSYPALNGAVSGSDLAEDVALGYGSRGFANALA